jgi:hypothetical protein
MKALLLNDTVVEVSENEFPVAPELEWVDCDDPVVKHGYIYKDGAFTDPTVKRSAMEVLRSQRCQLFRGTDMEMMRANETGTNADEWKAYRQELRDIPATYPNPELDADGNLINITWPIKPE